MSGVLWDKEMIAEEIATVQLPQHIKQDTLLYSTEQL